MVVFYYPGLYSKESHLDTIFGSSNYMIYTHYFVLKYSYVPNYPNLIYQSYYTRVKQAALEIIQIFTIFTSISQTQGLMTYLNPHFELLRTFLAL